MTADVGPRPQEPMLPVPYRVSERRVETHDCATLQLEPIGAAIAPFLPGQFTMLYRRGVGEVAISVSGDPSTADGALTQTVRDVGAVSRALYLAAPGDLVGVRGPYGTNWSIDTARGKDLLIVAGPVGPLLRSERDGRDQTLLWFGHEVARQGAQALRPAFRGNGQCHAGQAI